MTIVAALGHDDHSHDTGQAWGCRGTITTSSDHGDYANTYFKLTARYTDSGGLPATATAILQPRHKQAEYFTGSSGIRVVEQGDAENGKRIGDISPGDWISFKPTSLVGTTSIVYRVSSPYGGGTIELRVGSPTGQLLGATSVPNTGGWDNYETLPETPIGALGGGNRELFLVFQSDEDNHFDVDSFTRGGPGVGLPPG